MEKREQKNSMAVLSLVFGILGLISVCIIAGFPLCIIGLILGIIVLVKKKDGKGIAVAGIIISSVGIVLFLIIVGSVANGNEEAIETMAHSIQEESNTETSKEETTTQEETIVAETESEEDYKASCKEISYKKLLRVPDDYTSQRVIIMAQVKQVISGGLSDDGKYYRVQTDNDGYEYYFDDEYFMYDNRLNDDMKILDGDVLKIYGEFSGLHTIKRSMTGLEDEIPAIKAYYIELISE